MRAIAALVLCLALTGCAREYEANMQARQNIAALQTTNQRLAVSDVMRIVQQVVSPFEQKAKESSVVETVISRKNLRGSDLAVALMAHALIENSRMNAEASMMRARMQAMQYLIPIIEQIYNQHLMEFGTPMSTNELIAHIIDKTPVLAAIGGMYGVAAVGLKEAGDSFTATDNGAIAVGNQTAVGGSAIGQGVEAQTTTTTTTEIVEPTEEEPEEEPATEEPPAE